MVVGDRVLGLSDRRSFAFWYVRRHFRFLWRLCQEDVVQDIELFLLENRDRDLEDFKVSLQMFFYECAKKYGFSRYRVVAGRARGAVTTWHSRHLPFDVVVNGMSGDDDFVEDVRDEIFSSGEDFSERLVLSASVDFALAFLSDLNRRVLWMRLGFGFTTAEIARILGLSHEAVEIRVRKYRRRARCALESAGLVPSVCLRREKKNPDRAYGQ